MQFLKKLWQNFVLINRYSIYGVFETYEFSKKNKEGLMITGNQGDVGTESATPSLYN